MVEAWLQLYTLGPFAIQMAGAAPEAAAQGGPSPLRRKTRALLAYLAAAPAPVRRETLAAQLFGASDDPLGALRWQLSLIRRQLGPVLRTVDRGSLQLNREACWIDTAAFERDLAEGSTERLAAALRLYRGEYLAGLSLPDAPEFELWLLGRRAHYRKRYEQVLAELATALIAQGRLTDALSWAQLLVQSDALLEEGNLLLIRLYALTGQRDAALAHFEHYRRLLRAELGAEPDPTIAALHAAIAAGRPLPGLQPRAAPEGPQALRPTLPAPTTPLLGRETELAQLEAMLSDPTYRLVTIVGPGGIGKTRLALHVAAELAFRQPALFSDGVHVAELAAVPSGEAVIPAIADTLGYSFSGAGDPKRQLLAQLQGQKLLLVLDNFEHLAAEAGLLTELLRAAPGMTLLVTSRGRLSLYEEWCFELRGLATPDQAAPEEAIEASSAVQLFVTRARHLQRQFDPGPELATIGRICQLLEGNPLAIERDTQDSLRRDIPNLTSFEQLMSRAGIANDTTVVLYGDMDNWFAAYAFWLLKYYGHEDARLMNGGRKKWLAEGRPLTEEVPSYPATNYRVQSPAANLRALRDAVARHIGQEGAALVDVRSPDEYSGKLLAPANLPQEGAQRGGHIPGAVNIPWGRAVNLDGTFKSADELRELYTSHGITPDKDVIAYCRIGERSSHTWFVLKYLLGYPHVRNYDGSWTEWGSAIGVPIARD